MRSIIGDVRGARWGGLLAAQLAVQLAFTAFIRLFVEPRLRPAMHWRYGLDSGSDSHFFYQNAVQFRDCLEQSGWAGCTTLDLPGGLHVRALGLLFFMVQSSNPWIVFALNAVVSCASVVLLSTLLTTIGFERSRSRVIAAGLGITPLWMYAHSGLLREPYVVVALFSLLLALLRLLAGDGSRARPAMMDVAWVALLLAGYEVFFQLRPYILLPLFVALTLMVVVAAVWQIAGPPDGRVGWARVGMAATALLAVAVMVVVPRAGAVRAYADRADQSAAAAAIVEQRHDVVSQTRAEADAGKRPWRREDVVRLTGPCTIQWRPTPGVPASIDAKLQALSCARQEFQRACDTTALGTGADRDCDLATLASTSDVIRHLPSALAFGMLTPYPNVWLAGFGSGGTGLRRVGYVVDGLVAYASLPGLIMLAFLPARTRTLALSLLAAMVALLLIYGFSVPTQFVLSRMRMSIYVPVIAIGASALICGRRRRMPASEPIAAPILPPERLRCVE